MIYACCDSRRHDALERTPGWNGIDFLEVVDSTDDPPDRRQRTLLVHFVHPLEEGALGPANVRIEGGERRIAVVAAGMLSGSPPSSPPGDARVLAVEVAQPGDFSNYELRIVDAGSAERPPAGFDPVLSRVPFSFKARCPSDFDCLPRDECPAAPRARVDVSCLAKDYASFRQLLLDRMASLAPGWQERNIADLGIVLVELLAYVGDYLSYQQDAVATEAYLGTARLRTSVRRHVRLVGYPMHDGRNARTWIHFEAADGVAGLRLEPSTQLLTSTHREEVVLRRSSSELADALLDRPQVFELMEPVTISSDLNQIRFYTWGARECCLPKGATKAWLRGLHPDLKPGAVLVFQEMKGPHTGEADDADPARRVAVRLTGVAEDSDPLGGVLEADPTGAPVPLTSIEWSTDDATPFPICISSREETTYFDDVSVALGNIALADHGRTLDEALEPVPDANPALAPVAASRVHCAKVVTSPVWARYRPALQSAPLTFAEVSDPAQRPAAASALANRQIGDLRPSIRLLEGNEEGPSWAPPPRGRRDLLASAPTSKEFVVEVENDGTASLRFGDGRLGRRPAAGSRFTARYRVGNGTAGNVGADSIRHLVAGDPEGPRLPVLRVTNPMPASGGLDPESLEQVRQRAPEAFRVQERAVTEQDYGDLAQRCDPTLQRAVGTFRWTGSWRTVFVTADRKGGAQSDAPFELGLARCLERYRMAGHDIEIEPPEFVSLELDLDVCVKNGYFASDVEEALLAALGSRDLPDGRRGAFHPDNFTFGQTVHLSPVVAIAQDTDGVESVTVTKFQRQGVDPGDGQVPAKLELGRLQIARLDNDRSFPERGVLRLNMHGGQ